MDSDEYLEGQSMQRPPLFDSDSFIYWKNIFETYVKSKDLDLWYAITKGDFPSVQNNPETKKDEIVPLEKQNYDLKKRLAKNKDAKMVFSTWMAFGGNTLRGDGVAGIKQRHRDLYGDDVRNLATASGRDRLKEDLESSTWR
ncbi:hypothetical protein Tco_1244790 [Tanacetum coccineum]